MGEGGNSAVYAFLHICSTFFKCLVERGHEEFTGQAGGSLLTQACVVSLSPNLQTPLLGSANPVFAFMLVYIYILKQFLSRKNYILWH